MLALNFVILGLWHRKIRLTSSFFNASYINCTGIFHFILLSFKLNFARLFNMTETVQLLLNFLPLIFHPFLHTVNITLKKFTDLICQLSLVLKLPSMKELFWPHSWWWSSSKLLILDSASSPCLIPTGALGSCSWGYRLRRKLRSGKLI